MDRFSEEGKSVALALRDLEAVERLGGQLARSGFWMGAKRPEEAIALILVGRDLGISPTVALSNIYIVKGRVVLGYPVLASLVNRSGRYRYRVTARTEEICRIIFQEREGEQWVTIGESSFTIEEAKRAGLMSNPNWKNYPSDMLHARAMSRGVRAFCPDVVGGSVYVQGEVDEMDAEPVNITPTPRPIPVLTRALPEPEPLSSPEETEWNQAYGFLRMTFEEGVTSGKLKTGDGDVLEAAICRKLKLPSITEASAAQLTEQSRAFLAFLEGEGAAEKLVKMREAYASSSSSKATSSKGGAR